jgi:hypothetical protein
VSVLPLIIPFVAAAILLTHSIFRLRHPCGERPTNRWVRFCDDLMMQRRRRVYGENAAPEPPLWGIAIGLGFLVVGSFLTVWVIFV